MTVVLHPSNLAQTTFLRPVGHKRFDANGLRVGLPVHMIFDNLALAVQCANLSLFRTRVAMPKFPHDASKRRVIAALELLGFELVRDREHIQMRRHEPDGTITPLTMPAHRLIKGSTLRAICTQAGISREEFLKAFEKGG